MKKIVVMLLAMVVVSITAIAQSVNDWAELKQFHGVMSQTFHPAEEGNLKPIKERSAEMLEKARALNKSKVPASFDKPEVKAAVADLEKGAEALHKLIQSGKATDVEIKAKLSALHDVFHKIVGLCNKKDEHGHEH